MDIHYDEDVDITTTDHAFAERIDGIFVGTGGTVIVRLLGKATDSPPYKCQSGSYLWGRFSQVTKVGTTAADLVGVKYTRD